MTYAEISGSPLLYGLVGAGLIAMFFMCVYFYVQGKKRALELGISREKMKEIERSTVSVTLVPSLAIVVGMIALSRAVGTPWAWFRLSVVGSVAYELMAAQIAAASMGMTSLTEAAGTDASVFGAVMVVMSIGIIAGVIINALFGKQVIMGSTKLGKIGGGFGDVINGSFMVAMMAVFLPFQVIKGGLTTVSVILTSACTTVFLNLIIKKTGWKWLGEFTLAAVLIIGMASSLLWTRLFA